MAAAGVILEGATVFVIEVPFLLGLNVFFLVAYCVLIQLRIDLNCQDNLRTMRETCAKFTHSAGRWFQTLSRSGESLKENFSILGENKMLSLLADTTEKKLVAKRENNKSMNLRREMIKNLIEITRKAKEIGDKELFYLTSMALESAREKLYFQLYDIN